MTDVVDQIARSVLYEGYVLWPYRRSATKNRQRWTFGAVLPQPWASVSGTEDRWSIQTQCLVEGTPDVTASVRFLHVVQRQVLDGDGTPVDEIVAGGTRHLSWDEATEREITVPSGGADAAIEIPAGEDIEHLPEGAGSVRRSWERLTGRVTVGSETVSDDLHRLTVGVSNTTTWSDGDREQALRRGFISTHVVLRAGDGCAFVSLMDPPDGLRAETEACENVGTWPVLVGEPGSRDVMLSAPIILYDHPEVAPESPGDLFDGTEIDQLLSLSILGLTDEERDEMRATDPRVRAILERTEAMDAEGFLKLHGVVRDMRPAPEP